MGDSWELFFWIMKKIEGQNSKEIRFWWCLAGKVLFFPGLLC